MADEFKHALALVPKGAQLAFIYEHLELFKHPDVLAELLAFAWTREEGIYQPSYWLSVFEIAGFVTDTDERLTGELVIYRGTSKPSRARGMSWTLDLERARWFAHREAMFGHCEAGLVYEGRIEADRILAYFTDRQESEVVVRPSDVRALRRLEAVEYVAVEQ